MLYDPTYTWEILETDILLPNDSEHDLFLKVPTDGIAITSEVIVSETHIDPLRDDGFIIYKLGPIKAVEGGAREVSMLWGNGKVKTGNLVFEDTEDIVFTKTGSVIKANTVGYSGTFVDKNDNVWTVLRGLIKDPTPPSELLLTWNDIANVPVADASSVSDWNLFFDLPVNGTPFTSVIVVGNEVKLIGGSGITIKPYLFGDSDTTGGGLVRIIDNSNCIVGCGIGVFSDWNGISGCYGLTTVYFPACTTLADRVFEDCESLSDLIIPFDSFTSLGNSVFNGCLALVGTITFNNVVTAGDHCFSYCGGVSIFNFPELVSAGGNCFAITLASEYNMPKLVNAGYGCFNYNKGGVTNYDFPLLETAGDLAFADTLVTSLSFPSLVTAGDGCFHRSANLTSISLPVLQTIGDAAFSANYVMTTIYMPSLLQLGPTVGVGLMFGSNYSERVEGLSITLTIPAALMTCNTGNPDGDIQYLQLYNTVTIITI